MANGKPGQVSKLGASELTQEQIDTPVFLADTPQEKERAARFQQLRAEREADIKRGQQRAEQITPEGVFGRLQGFEAPEIQAARETRLRGLQRLQQAQGRQLAGRQAQTGIQGGLAGQQLANLQSAQQQQQAEQEQALFFEQAQRQQEVDKFNIDQQQKEFKARQAIAFGEAGLGAAERGAVLSQLAAEAGAAATAAAGSGGGGGGCFITTAVCEKLGLPDDNPILNKFRKFRDEHMGGKEKTSVYYDLAPKIVAAIKEAEDEDVYYEILSDGVIPAMKAIDEGDYDMAEQIYSTFVVRLKDKYVPDYEVKNG